MNAATIIKVYRLVFIALIVIASVQTLMEGPAHPHHSLIAAIEIAGALLMLDRRTRLPGAAALLVTFVLAQSYAASLGHWPLHYLQYAASTVMIVLLDRRIPGR